MFCEYIDANVVQPMDIAKLLKNKKINSHVKNGVSVDIVKVDKIKCLLLRFDKTNKAGTIGFIEGETITASFEYARKKKLPIVIIVSSGGIRVNEGTLALIQMIKMTNAVKNYSDKGLLYVAVVIDSALGGASASFVSLADIIIAEKNAIYGFTGKRIIEQSIQEQLPDGFQTAHYSKTHGMVDIVANKCEIKTIIYKLLKMHKKRGRL